jgi:DNA-binding response OmpR family regulator
MINTHKTESSFKSIAFLHSESRPHWDLQEKLKKHYRIQPFEQLTTLQDYLANHPKSIDLIIFCCDRDYERVLFKLLDSSSWQKMRTVPFWVLLETDDLTLMRYLFHKGIDDVFCLPLHFGEFLVKLDRAVSQEQPIREQSLFCDLTQESFNLNDFTRTETRLLSLFLSSKGKKFTRYEIIQAIWGRTVSQHQKTLNVHLHNLRKKLSRYGYTILNTSRGEWTIIQTQLNTMAKNPQVFESP